MRSNKLSIFVLILISFQIILIKGQNNIDLKQQSNNVVKSVNNSKTGNWNDVFTNFMQLAAKDLTGETKTFEYKTTIFALKTQVDSTLLIDTNYAKEGFSRNFQMNIGLNLDNDYKFKGFNYGFDWAVINKRDLSINTLVEKETAVLYEKYFDSLTNAREKYNNYLLETKDPERITKIKQIQKAIEKNNGKYIVPLEEFPKDFLSYLPKDYSVSEKYFNKVFEEDIKDIKRQPLLTFGFNSNFQKDSKFFDEYNVNMVYLQGIKSEKANLEIDFRNQFQAKDSITTSVLKRKEFSSQLGLNISLMKIKDRSIIELKPSFEYTKVFSGLAENEKDNIFTANADLRIRVLKNLWLPLILKYDIENSNFFGFLNVSFNFEAIKDE